MVGEGVEGKVEVEDVDAGFPEEAKLAGDGVLLHEVGYGCFGEMTLLGDARDLVQGGGGGDVGVKAGGGGGDEVDGDGGGSCLLGGDAGLGAVDECFAGGA